MTKYKCGHTSKAIFMDNNDLSYISYIDWKDSVGFDGDKSLCYSCYCKTKDKSYFNIDDNYNKIKKLIKIKDKTPEQNRELKQRLHWDFVFLRDKGLIRKKEDFEPNKIINPKLNNNLKRMQELMDVTFKNKEQQEELRDRLKVQKYYNDTGVFLMNLYNKWNKNEKGVKNERFRVR